MAALEDNIEVETRQSGCQTPPANGVAALKLIRRIVIFVTGMSVVLVGVAMLVLPGPGTIVIPAGLAILATEFVWARRWLRYLKRRARDVANWTSATVGVPPQDSRRDNRTQTPSQPSH